MSETPPLPDLLPKTNDCEPPSKPRRKKSKNSSERTSELSSSLAKVPKLSNPPGRLGLTRKQAALDRLGVTAKQLEAVPNITAILKEIPCEKHGRMNGKMLAFKAMQFSDQPLIQQFMDKFFRIPVRDRMSLSIEAIAIAAKINVHHLWGEIELAMRQHSANKVKAIAVAAHPDVMKARVAYAQMQEGFRDRDAIDTMLGALPATKGTMFIKNFFNGGPPPEAEEPETAEPEEDEDFMFPNAEVLQDRIQPMRQKLLESRK